MILFRQCHQSLGKVAFGSWMTYSCLVEVADQNAREQVAHCLIFPEANLPHLLSDALDHLQCDRQCGCALRFSEYSPFTAFLQHEPHEGNLHLGVEVGEVVAVALFQFLDDLSQFAFQVHPSRL